MRAAGIAARAVTLPFVWCVTFVVWTQTRGKKK